VSEQGCRDLGRLLKIERDRLRLRQKEFADAIGVPLRTYGPIERGHNRSHKPWTMDRIEIALCWQVGSVERVVNEEGPPVLVDDPEFDRLSNAWRRLSIRDRRLLADGAENAATLGRE
jgi:transcriptional regulator with XRE-family HTH domain